jgi:hypothetical protein
MKASNFTQTEQREFAALAWFCVADYTGAALVEWSGGMVRSRRKHG